MAVSAGLLNVFSADAAPRQYLRPVKCNQQDLVRRNRRRWHRSDQVDRAIDYNLLSTSSIKRNGRPLKGCASARWVGLCANWMKNMHGGYTGAGFRIAPKVFEREPNDRCNSADELGNLLGIGRSGPLLVRYSTPFVSTTFQYEIGFPRGMGQLAQEVRDLMTRSPRKEARQGRLKLAEV